MTPNDSGEIASWIGAKTNDPADRPFAVIAKSADVCNYRCSYCYVEHTSSIPIMSVETAAAAIANVADYVGTSRRISFIWHGGEPLLAGSRFFERVVELSGEFPNHRLEHCIQTNGSLLEDDFLRFCAEHGVAVSLSFDGPAQIHDANRVDAAGRGTHLPTMAALARVKEAGLTPGCVCVLHRQNVDHVAELYAFFRDNGINFRVNPVVRSGRARENYNALAVSPREYGLAMIELFDLWFSDNGAIQVEPLHTIVGNFVGPSIWGCDYHGRCLESIISVNPDGGVYPCGRFAGLEEFRLGSILSDSLASIFSSALSRDLCNRGVDTVKGCVGCPFGEICNAGCMITAHMANGDIGDQDYYCGGRAMLFSHIANRLRTHLAEAELRTRKEVR